MVLQFTGSLGPWSREFRLNPGYPRPAFRFSFRFNTPRRKRLLLVQLVSVEVSDEEDAVQRAHVPAPTSCATWADSYTRLLSEYERLSLLTAR